MQKFYFLFITSIVFCLPGNPPNKADKKESSPIGTNYNAYSLNTKTEKLSFREYSKVTESASEKETVPTEAAILNRRYKRIGMGINTDRVFSRDQNRKLIINYTGQDFQNIRDTGFKHIRLTIREPLMLEKWPDSLAAGDIATIKQVVDQVLSYNLPIVFNPVHASDNFKKRLESEPELQQGFICFWKALAKSFNTYDPEKFLIEPFNEPHFKDAQIWYNLQEKLVAEIRKVAPRHTLVMAPVTESVNAVTGMPLLQDRNVLYTFHFYLPFELTHQGAEWTWKPFPKGYRYPNADWNGERIRQAFFEPVSQWAKKNNIKLYGGEFGVINRAAREDRVKWYQDVMQLMRENSFAGAVWEYKSGAFSILADGETQTGNKTFDLGIIEALKLKGKK